MGLGHTGTQWDWNTAIYTVRLKQQNLKLPDLGHPGIILVVITVVTKANNHDDHCGSLF